MKQSKQELRRAIRQQKQAMDEEEILRRSSLLCDLFLQTEAYKAAKTVYGYLPMNQEVRTEDILRQALADGKQVALPKCFGKTMEFILVEDLSRVTSSAFGAPEPVENSPVARDETALVLVPGIAFDRRGHRLGYGGGYYDRFLAREPEHPTISLCYDFQLLPHLEAEPHDIPVQTVFWI